MIIQKMKHFTVNPNEIVIEQGKPAVNFFICVLGKLEVLVNGDRKKLIRPGEGFGEVALLHDTERTATIKSLDKVILWGLDRLTFRNVVETVNASNYAENKVFINNIPLF